MQRAILRHPATATVAAIVAILMLVSGPQAEAQQGIGPDYVVRAGDVLQIYVYDESGLNASYRVGPSGYINIPLVGPVKVGGHTLSELQRLLRKKLMEVLRDPYVTVGVDESASSRQVTVTGFVTRTGTATLPMNSCVRDAVIHAGITERSNLSAVELRRDGQIHQTVDLSGLREARQVSEPVPLQWGDVVYVPRILERIAVLGEVKTPSVISLPVGERLTVLDAIKEVGGGFAPEADPTSARLLRKGSSQPISVDLHALIQEGDVSQNYELSGGDVLLVEQGEPITVFGAVNRPTTFHTREPINIVEAVIRAGGFSAESDVANAELIRDGQHSFLDLETLWKEGDLSQNVEIRPGDYLSVPYKEAEEILVTGAVGHSGPMDITEMDNTGLLKIILMAQPTEQADLTRVQVYRDDGTIVRNLKAAREEGDMSQDLELQPADVVMVPERDKVYLVGALSKPGIYPYYEDWALFDYLSRGGLGGEVEAREGAVIRPSEEGEAEVYKIDLGKLTEGSVPDIDVQPGDIIFFKPPEPDRDLLDYLREYLWLFDLTFRLLD